MLNSSKSYRVSTSFITSSRFSGDLGDYIRESIGFHKSAGFDALDFSMGLIAKQCDDWQRYIEIALESAAHEGIRFEICHLPFSTAISTKPELLPEFCAGMHFSIDAAAMLGVDVAVLHPNAVTHRLDEYDEEREYENVLSHLAPFVEHAERVGVKLALENMRLVHESVETHRFCQSPEELCRVADELGIGVCWDFGHAQISGVKQSEGLAYVGGRLKAVHINDNFGLDDIHIPVFTGRVDWRDAMRGLSEIGFCGPLNFELATGRIPPEMHGSFAAYMLKSAETLASFCESELL